jgi:hypothetical protein
MTYLLTEVLRQVSLTPGANSGLMRGEGNREMPSKRRTTMKRITALAFLTAALISMGSACAHAQAPAFKVPFDFTVGNQVLPAGTYQVSYASQTSENGILIRSKGERPHAALTTTYPADPSTGVGKLIFTKYGNQYFLHKVLCSAMNVALPASRLEKRARIQEAHLPHSEAVAALRTGAK